MLIQMSYSKDEFDEAKYANEADRERDYKVLCLSDSKTGYIQKIGLIIGWNFFLY